MEKTKGKKDPPCKWKGKFISRKKLELKLNLIARISEAKKRRDVERARAAGQEAEAQEAAPEECHNCNEGNENLPANALLVGNRIVDIRVFSESMKCCRCKQPLSLQQTQNEKRFGLYSVFHVLCLDCNIISEVHTGTVKVDGVKRPVPDINKQAVLGMFHAESYLYRCSSPW